MEVIVYLIPPTLILVGIFIGAFFWAVKDNQYEDLEGPAQRLLYQEENNNYKRNKKRKL